MMNEKNIPARDLLELSSRILNSNHTIQLRLGGVSMYPLLREGDIGCINKCAINALKIGDVIVFEKEKKWIAHRLIKKEFINDKYVLTTKGDSRSQKDIAFTEEQYVGKIISFKRKGKDINMGSFFYSTYGLIFANATFLNTRVFVLNKLFWPRLLKYIRRKVM